MSREAIGIRGEANRDGGGDRHGGREKQGLTNNQIQPLCVCVGVKVRESPYPRVRYVYVRCGSGRRVGISSSTSEDIFEVTVYAHP